MIDVALAIDDEAVDAVLIRRGVGSYNNDGDFMPGAETTTPIRAAIQPATGRQLMDLPEGIRTEAKRLLWSRTAISENDTITHDGIDYRVMFVWPRHEGGFTRAALGMLKEGSGP